MPTSNCRRARLGGRRRSSYPRRVVLARARNRLLSAALRDEEWVLWLDVDLVDYPPDVLRRLLATGKRIVTPHCVIATRRPDV